MKITKDYLRSLIRESLTEAKPVNKSRVVAAAAQRALRRPSAAMEFLQSHGVSVKEATAILRKLKEKYPADAYPQYHPYYNALESLLQGK